MPAESISKRSASPLGVFALVVAGLLGLAIPRAYAVSEANYIYDMKNLVAPFYESGVEGRFAGKGGVSIRYRKWEVPNELGAVVVLPGRGDPYETYDETIYDLAQKGYSIYAMDERGQGGSERLLQNPQLGYVKSFDDYVFDLMLFYAEVVNHRPHEREFLLAHSMGGEIGALFARQFPPEFTGIVFVCPMLKFDTDPYSNWEARLLDSFELLFGRGEDYAPTQHDYDPNEPFEGNKVTSSELRWQHRADILRSHPELTLGGATNAWVSEGFRADDEIHSHANEIKTPILLLTAGADRVVDVPEQAYFCQKAQHCTQAPVYADARHSLLLEHDSYRNDAMERILKFFASF